MAYIYLLIAMTFSALLTVVSRIYNNKCRGIENVSALFSLVVSFSAAVSWFVLWCTDFTFDLRVLPYSLLYGVAYTLFTVGMLGAIKTGSTSLTALIKQVALVGVSFWGFAFWDTPITALAITGIVLLILSLFLCLITKEAKNDSYDLHKWLLCAGMITVGNAGASIIQRYQQMAFDYKHKYMFMFFGLLSAFLFCALTALCEDKKNWSRVLKSAWAFPAMAGAATALANVFILLLVNSDMSPAILYPGVAVGGLMITTVISFVFFRERLRPLQWVGLAVGAVSLVLLNL